MFYYLKLNFKLTLDCHGKDVRLFCLLHRWTPYLSNEQTIAAKNFFCSFHKLLSSIKQLNLKEINHYSIVIFFRCDLLIDIENECFSAYLALKLCLSG